MQQLVSRYRTHTCGELRIDHVGERVSLAGWIMRKRDHGGVIFIDLRDHYGVTQVVFPGDRANDVDRLRVESVVRIGGAVHRRESELVNPKIPTGEIEIHSDELEVLSQAEVLPFMIAEDDRAPEATRLRYRFLDLRRERLHNNIILRTAVIRAIREIMQGMGFMEIQTPILTSSSPEGARDFLVPSRFHPGSFFALPQAPQQFKQLLMVAGFDRYFQIAPCFRDEDPRADRSPGEFYQLDLEMSFVEQEDVFQATEHCLYQIFTRFSSKKITEPPFPRISYKDAMAWFGSDKPDLRISARITDISSAFRATEFKVFRAEVDRGGEIAALKYMVNEIPPRKFFDDTLAEFKNSSGQGLAYLIFEDGVHRGSIAKFMAEQEINKLKELLDIGRDRYVVFMAAGLPKEILPHVGALRVNLARYFGQVEKDAFRFCWITDFPMYELDEKSGRIVFSHNPFSMPQGGMRALQEQDPLEIKAFQYDSVCNGVELSSGAIRNHLPEIMYKAFEIAGYSKEIVDQKFGGMIRAFLYGAPPHGGIAPGIDRIIRLLADEDNLREVITFPMAQSVEDLMMGAPSTVSDEQLKELHIRVELPPERKLH